MSVAPEGTAPSGAQKEAWRRAATGGFMMMTGRAAGLPLGLVVSALLARALGPESFGHFTVSVSMIMLAQSTIGALFNRTAIKIVADATTTWKLVAVAISRLELLLGTGAALLILLSADMLASLMATPELAHLLRLLAISLPLGALAGSLQNAMIARHLFNRSALFPVVYDIARLVLVIVFLVAGWELTGAIMAVVGSILIQLAYALWALPLPLWARAPLLPWGFFRQSLPLALDALGKRLYSRIDLWAVQAIGGSVAAGHYGAVQSFNAIGLVVSASLAPLVLATVTRAWTIGELDTARSIMRQTLRLAFCVLPFAALGSGSAPELIAFVYGSDYLPAAPVLAWMSFAIAGLVVMSLVTVMMAAIGRPGAAFAFNTPLLGLALLGCFLLIPRVGPAGAAATITITTWAVNAAMLAKLRGCCGVTIGLRTVLRVLFVTVLGYAMAASWQVPAEWVIVKLLPLCGIALLLMLVLGEFTRAEITGSISLVRRQREQRSTLHPSAPPG